MPTDDLSLVDTSDLMTELARRSRVCAIVIRPLAVDPE